MGWCIDHPTLAIPETQMNDFTTGRPARRSKDKRIAAIIASGLLALVALGFIGAGGVSLWADSKKDEQGYIATGSDRFNTDTAALATENLDLDLDGAESLVDEGVYGKVRIKAESKDGKQLFVGIARTSAVNDYLRGSAHDIIDDVEYSPFHVEYRTESGDASPGVPGAKRFWDASVQGAGEQSLVWDVEDGDWSVVVMNADGTPGVDAGVSVGASVSWLDEVGKIAMTTGFILLILAGGLLYVGVRQRPQSPLGGTDQATVSVA